jgi:hypothetical protein
MDKLEVIVSILTIIVGIFVSYFFYKLNKSNILNNQKDSERYYRINVVINEYKKLLATNKSSDIPGLISAGIATLHDEEEAKEAVEAVANLQGKRNPLSSRQSEIEEIGILKFFQHITHQQYITNQMDSIIKKLREN